MIIKTVAPETKDFENATLTLVDVEYDDAFTEQLSCEISAYSMHTVYIHDYESSGDSGDGRDDYYTEEEDLQIELSKCIIKDRQFYGVVCECFERQASVSLDRPETTIYHPKNYGGNHYHYYRKKRFTLIKK